MGEQGSATERERESAQKGLVIMRPGCPGNSDSGRGTATATVSASAPSAAAISAPGAATESGSESSRVGERAHST